MLIVLGLVVIGVGGYFVYKLVKGQGEYEDEQRQESLGRFLKGGYAITNEVFSSGLMRYFPEHQKGPLFGVYVISNPARKLMLIKSSEDLIREIVEEMSGLRNRDLALDGESGNVMIELALPRDGETLVMLLRRIREEKGITDDTDYEKSDVRDQLARAPKRDKRRVQSTRDGADPMYWERRT